jgi:hypothetical protein
VKRSPLKRHTRLKRGWKRDVTHRHSPVIREAWRASVVVGGCVLADDECRGPVQAHHVLPKRVLKREGHEAKLWDQRNGVGLCELHHARVERRIQALPAALIPAGAWAFADEIGLRWWLDRFYGERA